MFITAANHPADPRKEELPVLYIHHFVSLSARSTALETNCHDKSTRVDFSREARRFRDDGLGFLALITVIRKLVREDGEISSFSTISERYKKYYCPFGIDVDNNFKSTIK